MAKIRLVCNLCGEDDNFIRIEDAGESTNAICSCGNVEYMDWLRCELVECN